MRSTCDILPRFYEAWFDRAFAMARSITRRDESFCLDVVQDSMMRVVKKMRPLADEKAVRAWMARTLFTTAIDRLRSESRRARRESRVAAATGEALAGLDPVRGEQIEWIREQLRALPEDDRRLILERFAGDRTLEEVGRSLGITGHAAHGRIRRILIRMRNLARELFDE